MSRVRALLAERFNAEAPGELAPADGEDWRCGNAGTVRLLERDGVPVVMYKPRLGAASSARPWFTEVWTEAQARIVVARCERIAR